MIYMNSNRMLFDVIDNCSSENDYISGSESFQSMAEKIITTNKTKIWVQFECYSSATSNNNIHNEIITFYFSNNNALIFVNEGTNQRIFLSGVSGYYQYTRSTWKKVRLIIDSSNGYIEMYGDGLLCYSGIYSKIAETTLKKIRIRPSAYTNTWGKYCSRIRNIIISDEEIKPNTSIKEIPLTVESSEWDKNEETYTTDEAEKKIVYNIDKSVLDGCITKATVFGYENTQTSETINTVTVDDHDMQLSDIGLSAMVELNVSDIEDGTIKVISK